MIGIHPLARCFYLIHLWVWIQANTVWTFINKGNFPQIPFSFFQHSSVCWKKYFAVRSLKPLVDLIKLYFCCTILKPQYTPTHMLFRYLLYTYKYKWSHIYYLMNIYYILYTYITIIYSYIFIHLYIFSILIYVILLIIIMYAYHKYPSHINNIHTYIMYISHMRICIIYNILMHILHAYVYYTSVLYIYNKLYKCL